MTSYRTPFAALAAMIARAFNTHPDREKSVHWVTLFPATARAAIQRPGHRQPDGGASLGRRRPLDRD
jgi:hypothetical protein